MLIHVNDVCTIEWQNQHSLLEALEDSELEISYSCRSGACGACKIQLRSGSVTWIQQPSVSLTKNEILACCVIPNSDISIQLPN